MFCPKCGIKNDGDGSFCGKCGTPLTSDKVPQKEKQYLKSIIISIAIFILLVFGIRYFYHLVKSANNQSLSKTSEVAPFDKTVNETLESKEELIQNVSSRYVNLKVIHQDGEQILKINDKNVSDIKNITIRIEEIFQIENTDVVLVWTTDGLNNYSESFYQFITIKPDGTYRVAAEIINEDNHTGMTPEQRGDEIIIKENIDYGEGKIVTYSNGVITEKPRVIWTTGAVAKERCEALFEWYKTWCKDGSSCSAAERSYRYLMADKRVNSNEFDKMCIDFGKTHKPVDYDNFKKSVCISN